jgi:hypothetical protein
VTLSGDITGDDADANKVVTHAKNGFEWQASVGATVDRREFLDAGKTAKVNGRDVTGPLIIARKATLVETSFVAIGASQTSSAKVAATQNGDTTMNFNEWLAAKGFDPESLTDEQNKALKAAFDAENAPPAKPDANDGGTGGNVTANGSTGNRSTGTVTRSLEQIRAENKRQEDIEALAVEYARKHPTQIDMIQSSATAAIENTDTTPQQLELQLLRDCRSTPANTRPSKTAVEGLDSKVVEAAVCMAGGLANIDKHFPEETLDAAQKRHRSGIGLEEVLVMAARQHGYDTLSAKNVRRTLEAAFSPTEIRAGFSTISLPEIFSNVMNKFLLQGFSSVESAWRSIARVRPVRDFKQIKNIRRIGQTLFEQVGPDGELKHGTMGEEVFTNQAQTYGGMYGITRQDIINDDLDALTNTPQDIGRDGGIRLNKEFWTEFLNNSAFFTADRNNLLTGAGSALDIDALSSAETAFFDQKDPNGNPLGVMPRILLVPNALNVQASKITRDTEVRHNEDDLHYTTGNPHAGKFTPVRSSYLSDDTISGSSNAAWYLLAAPEDLAVIEAVFLNGIQQPTVEQAEANFNTLGIQMRGYFDFGINKQDHRAGVKSAGQ